MTGRQSKCALGVVAQPSLTMQTTRPLTTDVRLALHWTRKRVCENPPREVRVDDQLPLFLFLDGACEPMPFTSVGGVLLDHRGKGISCFGVMLPDVVANHWSGGRKRQLNFEAEVLPRLIALTVWKQCLANRCVVVFLDNEAPRRLWVAGRADAYWGKQMTFKGTLLEARINCRPYFSRVPTYSNIADAPSRLDFDLWVSLGLLDVM